MEPHYCRLVTAAVLPDGDGARDPHDRNCQLCNTIIRFCIMVCKIAHTGKAKLHPKLEQS
jgi:hypothetical protein